jgi:hypothetical protein
VVGYVDESFLDVLYYYINSPPDVTSLQDVQGHIEDWMFSNPVKREEQTERPSG